MRSTSGTEEKGPSSSAKRVAAGEGAIVPLGDAVDGAALTGAAGAAAGAGVDGATATAAGGGAAATPAGGATATAAGGVGATGAAGVGDGAGVATAREPAPSVDGTTPFTGAGV